ncbi:M20 family metallopeptidase [Clostridium swellfunianum]|uniref:M20 family metallopeptidase n=1 Tax=Clostridium swellfunianum TaxID=1367462 RepID=UPI00202ECF41|nr:M20 family metallopeptidase [Clostridium swellfunianum]MCM0647347.1 M20 family metallopeptidase [Clostridium swellfunianum]
MKENLFKNIDDRSSDLIAMADYIFDNPELAFKEYKASKLLEDYLEKNGFTVERGLGSLDTAFKAVYENGTGGPNIGLLCEYDALPMGHGCAHHLQGPAIVGAAIALKELYKGKPYKLIVYGTPAEEGGGGKIKMLNEGYIKELDVALMAHGGPATQVDVKSLAASSIKVIYHGKSAHAALKPEQGRSALDALLLTFHAVEFLREHVLEDTRMHYTVVDAGGPNNVVPKTAAGSFSLRSYNSSYLKSVISRFEDIVKGAALMTGTTYEIIREKDLDSKVPVYSLNDVVMNNAKLINAPNIKPAREKTGSSDFGNVMYVIPGSCIRISFVDENASSHSQEFLDDGKSERGHAAVIYAAKILAGTAFDLIDDASKLLEVKQEFNATKAKMSLE